jgi:hypothetical protein
LGHRPRTAFGGGRALAFRHSNRAHGLLYRKNRTTYSRREPCVQGQCRQSGPTGHSGPGRAFEQAEPWQAHRSSSGQSPMSSSPKNQTGPGQSSAPTGVSGCSGQAGKVNLSEHLSPRAAGTSGGLRWLLQGVRHKATSPQLRLPGVLAR